MKAEQVEKAYTFIDSKSGDGKYLEVAMAFVAQDETFFMAPTMRPSVMERTSPLNWWKAQSRCEKIPNGFVDLVVRLFRCPASSASIERMFSTFGHLQTKSRNRLKQEKLSKLTFCYRMLRSEEQNEECTALEEDDEEQNICVCSHCVDNPSSGSATDSGSAT